MNVLADGYGKCAQTWNVRQEDAPGYSRVYYIVEGLVYYKENNITRKLQTNTLYIFPATKAYSIDHSPYNCIECLWFHIDFLPIVVNELIEISVEKESSFQHLLQALITYACSTDAKDNYYYSLIDSIVCFLEQNYLHNYPKKLEDVIAYIRQNYKNDLSVSHLSQYFGYSNEYFIRLFRESISITPYQFILNCKLHEAQKLLLQDIPVTQVAQLTGFRDAKTFSRIFKQKYCIAPSQFKKYYNLMG